jgi:hypothetical protein
MRDLISRCIRAGEVAACANPRVRFNTDAAPVKAELRAATAGLSNVQVIDGAISLAVPAHVQRYRMAMTFAGVAIM